MMAAKEKWRTGYGTLIEEIVACEENQVIIPCGLPGSGKTTFTQKLAAWFPNFTSVSADDYWMVEGRYEFDASRLQDAHDDCLRRFLDVIPYGRKLVVVDNTNLSAVEIAPYYRLGQIYRYRPLVVRLHCDPEKAFQRQLHGVPEQKHIAMGSTFLDAKFPPYWRVENVRVA